MYCETCKYNIPDPGPAICRRCGRYTENKITHIAFVAAAALALAFSSHYLLTGRIFGGDRLMWVRSALTVPGSIYFSSAYMTAVGLSLAGILAVSVLAGFHYGVGVGLLIAAAAGALSGVELGGLVLGLTALAAGLPRLRRVPAPVWPVLAAAGGGCYYVYLAWHYGPASSEVYRRALMVFVAAAGLVAAAAAGTEALVSARAKYRSSYLIVFAALAAGLPVTTGLAASRPSVIEANIVTTLYAPERVLENPLGEGFAAGQAGRRPGETSAGEQIGHVFDVIEYVDATRAKAIEACEAYLKRHANAPSAAEVLLLKALMHDARADLTALRLFNRLECYFDRVSAEGEHACEEIIDRFADSPQAALARYRVAEAEFQKGKIREAQKLFAGAEEALAPLVPDDFYPAEPPRPASIAQLFQRPSAGELRRRNELYQALVNTRRRLSLISHNGDYGSQPLARLGSLDERSDLFEKEAASLAAGYPDSLLQDNIQLMLAERLRDPLQRLGTLENLLEKYAGSDVEDRMLLSVAKARLSGDLAGTGKAKAELALRRLLADYPESTYAAPARLLLERLQSAAD